MRVREKVGIFDYQSGEKVREESGNFDSRIGYEPCSSIKTFLRRSEQQFLSPNVVRMKVKKLEIEIMTILVKNRI